jgi:hemerythrin superfamily protein
MGWKKSIHLLRQSIFELHTFSDYLIDTYSYIDENATFSPIFGHRVTYQAKEQQMPVRHFTQLLGNFLFTPFKFFCFL